LALRISPLLDYPSIWSLSLWRSEATSLRQTNASLNYTSGNWFHAHAHTWGCGYYYPISWSTGSIV
jgi:hypothetical protein